MMKSVRFLTAVISLGFLAACGGGAGSAIPPSTGGGSHAQGGASISFFIPTSSQGSSVAASRAKTLPATTQSVVVAVTAPDGSQFSPPISTTLAIGPTAPGCSVVTGGISCTENVAAQTGSVIFWITAYDGPNGTGNVLSTASIFATVTAGQTTPIQAALGTAVGYIGTGLDGNFQTATIDHQAKTFSIAKGTGSASGTYTTLPNGDYKVTITSTTGSFGAVGNIGYVRELPNVALVFEAVNGTASSQNGSSMNGDLGVMVAQTGCATANATVNVAGVQIPSSTWVASTSKAYTVGTATISGSGTAATISYVGTAYTFGTATYPQSGGNQTCAGGIYSATGQGSVVFSPLGLFVTVNGGTGTSDTVAGVGMRQPSAPLNLASVEAATFNGFAGGYTSGTTSASSPGVIMPGTAANTMSVCPYTTYESNVVSTSCRALTVTGQPFPGIIAASDALGDSGYFVVNQFNGKYVLFGVGYNAQTPGSFGPTFLAIQK